MRLFCHDCCKDAKLITYIAQTLGVVKLSCVRYVREFK